MHAPSPVPHRLLGMLLLAGLAACGSGASTPEPDAPAAVVLRRVAPPATGPGIRTVSGDHVVMLAGGARGELFVFYPGTGASPDRYESLLLRAAELGYHAVGLDYVNTDSINFEVCNAYPDEPDCHERARREILLGEESGFDPPEVDAANAAFHRLARLLAHLDAAHPSEGWSAFLDGASPRWHRIAFGGHSQGGGHAAMTAKLHAVARVLLFGATEPRPWTTAAFRTPADRMFGFAHVEEINFGAIVQSWAQLGMPGALTDVDDAEAPFGGSHRLATACTDCVGDPGDRGLYHNCPVVDEVLPLDGDGAPVFLPVWDHMLTADPPDAPAPPPGPAFVVSPPETSWVDPELARLDGIPWLACQDDTGAVLLARLDEARGTVRETWRLGAGAAPLLTTFNGPEFGVDARGWALYYSRLTSDGVQAARIGVTVNALTGGLTSDTTVLTSGDEHFSPLASTAPDLATGRLLLLRRPPAWGTVHWVDLVDPAVAFPLAHLDRRTDGDARWAAGTSVLATNAHPGHLGQVVLLDTDDGSVTPVSDEPTTQVGFPYAWRAPEADGGLAVLGTVGPTEVGIWQPDALGAYTRTDTLTAPPGAPPYVGSPEPFVVGDRSYVSLTLAAEADLVPGVTDQQVWILGLDGTFALRCDEGSPDPVTRVDPEVLLLGGQAFVYWYVLDGASSTVYARPTGLGTTVR